MREIKVPVSRGRIDRTEEGARAHGQPHAKCIAAARISHRTSEPSVATPSGEKWIMVSPQISWGATDRDAGGGL